ncbi:hypothetical protein Q7P35_010474 [Cladosporium inversicolor]
MAPGSTIGTPANSNRGTKVNPPIEFTGRRDQIKSFRLQCKLYWEMHPEKFEKNARGKMLFAMSYLRGKALEWIQPYMEDYIDNTNLGDLKDSTIEILGSVDKFFDNIKQVFDVGNDTLEADRDLRQLRQKTSATTYRAEFSILAAKVGVEITMRYVRPLTLKEMAELAIKIDSRIFEVQMEKKENADRCHVGCGKKGHYKNECNAWKQRHDLQNPGHSKNGFRTTKGKTAESVENAKVSDETRVESIRATQGRGVYDTTRTITPEQDSHTALT